MTTYRVISETHGLMWTGTDRERAEIAAITVAVSTARTVYLNDGQDERTPQPVPPVILRDAYRTLQRLYTKHRRWHRAIGAYIDNGQQPGTAPPRRWLPSKASKHRMYAAADTLLRLLAIDRERPSTLNEIGLLLVEVSPLIPRPRNPRR